MQTIGFVLTRHWRDTRNGIEIELWCLSETGPLQIIIPAQQAVFFLAEGEFAAARRQIGNSLCDKSSEVALKNFDQQAVRACYFNKQKNARKASDTLTTLGFTPLESDIKPSDRYLMERFIKGGFQFSDGIKSAATAHSFAQVSSPKLQPSNYKPDFSVVSLDIETAMHPNQLYSIGLWFDGQRLVFMVGEGADTDWLKFHPNETAAIEAFLQWTRDVDPDVFIGWNVINFDFWYIQRRCKKLDIVFSLGRDGSAVNFRETDDSGERFAISIRGRVVIDGIDTLRTAGYRFESFSLQSVASDLLGEGKLLSGNDRGGDITELYLTDKLALAEYNVKDCQLVWDIFNQEKLVEFCLARAQLTGLPIDRVGGSVAAFDFQYLPLLHRAGYVAPSGMNKPAVASPGGYVLSSSPGIYDHVLVLDFKSLYPSIIRTFCIDPMAMAEGLSQDFDSTRHIEGFVGARFSRDNHLLPKIIKQLWMARDEAKKNNDGALSQAIKIIMNSFYGVLGSNGCRFFDTRLASSITLRGHQIIMETKEFIEQQGYTVIYGDTDSLFVWVKDCVDSAQAKAVGVDLAVKLNHWWKTRLETEMNLESVLELEFETHFKRFLMPTIRGSEAGSKKRYAGVVENEQGEDKLVFKGLEAVRTDWTRLARDFQIELYKKIFNDEPFEEFVKSTVSKLQAGESDADLLYRKKLRQSLDDYVKNIPPHIQAARKLQQWGGLVPKRGDWIEYVITVAGPEPASMQRSRLDYDFYVERQLAPAADGILQFYAKSLEQIVAAQMGMF
jgi:DNA polymerase-2